MQDPNEDTEWNDVLRSKGIIPEKEIREEDIVDMVEKTVKAKVSGVKSIDEMNLDELDELEDEEEERVLEEYRRRRIAEIKALSEKSKFGDVREISAQDYVKEVNEAGSGIHVVLHLFKPGIPLCSLVNKYMSALAHKFPSVKFLKSVSNTCIPNYPDKNLPTLFIYYEGAMKTQLVGPLEFRGMNLTLEEFEYILGKTGAISTSIKSDPKTPLRDVMFSSLKDSDGDNDW